MEIELMSSHKIHNFSVKMEDGVSVEKAAFDGIESMEKLITLLSEHKQKQSPTNSKGDSEIEMDCREVTDVTVNKFRKMITLLDRTRTGHARFRRSHPCDPLQTMQAKDEGNEVKEDKDPLKPKIYCPTPLQRLPPVFHNLNPSFGFINGKKGSSLTNSVGSSLTSDVQNRGPSAFHVASISGGHHPLSSSVFKKRCMTKSEDLNGRCIGSSGRCHCSKKRKFRVKRTMRVPAISLKMADIPPDNFSWRKYGQKPIKGSPYPRGYYKCSSVRGCPARKHVERAIDDPTMLIVTYEGDHNHTISASSHALVPHSSCKKIETK